MRKELGVSVSKRPKTLAEFFDEWRALYDYMPYDQSQNIYSTIYSIVKNQNSALQFNKFAIANFFHNLSDDLNVVEIGSWNGQIASFCISKFANIIDWTGIEVCKEAAMNVVCKSDRYRCFIPNNYIWDIDHDYSRYNTMVFTRYIERIKVEHFIRIIEQSNATIDNIYIEAHILKYSHLIDWNREAMAGILEVGWDDVVDIMKSFGYKNTYQYKTVGFFQR
jgi:hypothetical protein